MDGNICQGGMELREEKEGEMEKGVDVGWKSRFWIFNIYNLSSEPRDDLYPPPEANLELN